MKIKKATKRLSRVETLLSGVLNGYATDIAEIREPLEAASAAVKRARSAIDSNQSSSNRQGSSRSGQTPATLHRRAAGERTPPAMNNRTATAERKGSGSATASAGKSSPVTKSVSAKSRKGTTQADKRRTENQRAARNAPATAAQRRSRAGKKSAPAHAPAAQEVPANGATTQAPPSAASA